jgi:hypothetical protein
VIRLAKLVLWALQDDRVASAWRLYDNHVCGAVAISAGEKKTRKRQKIGRNRNTFLFLDAYQMLRQFNRPLASLIPGPFLLDILE